MEDLKPIWRVNLSPRFTALEMGEYMATDEGPRETFVRGMKYERLARTLTYRRVYQAVAAFLSSPTRDSRLLERCRKELNQELEGTFEPQSAMNIRHELAALAAFEQSLNHLPLGGIDVVRASHVGGKLNYFGTIVSVRPTVLLYQRRPRTDDLVGAMLLDVAKGNAIKTPEAAAKAKKAMEHTAILLHEYVATQLCTDGQRSSRDLALTFHCYRQETVSPPSAYQRTMRNIEAVCRQLKRDWVAIEPPATFDTSRATYRK